MVVVQDGTVAPPSRLRQLYRSSCLLLLLANVLSSVRDMLPTLAIWVLLLPSTLAAILPQYDPFYNAPAGYQSEAPGTILRTRRVVTSYVGFIPDGVQAWQLLYLSLIHI